LSPNPAPVELTCVRTAENLSLSFKFVQITGVPSINQGCARWVLRLLLLLLLTGQTQLVKPIDLT